MFWRDNFAKELALMKRRDIQVATQILTGHAALNYHLSKLNRTIQPTCPLCMTEEETVAHFLGQQRTSWTDTSLDRSLAM